MNRKSLTSLAAGLAIACSLSPAHAQTSPAVTTRALAVRQSIAPGVLSEVAFTTLPNAVCTLGPQGATDDQHTLKLYADDEGKVRFHARPPADVDPADAPKVAAQLMAQCVSNGQSVSHTIELQPVADAEDSSLGGSSTAIHGVTNATRSGQTVRPALKGDPMRFTSEELVMQGYPPRPDPDEAPEAYATWMHAVSKPSTFVAAKTVDTHRFHGPAADSRLLTSIPITKVLCCLGPQVTQKSFNNWSGFAVRDGNKYDAVIGEWVVPSVTGETNVTDHSSFWIGLDGDASSDVLQDGTEQQVVTYNIFGFTWAIATYYAWTEWFPLSEQVISNFSVHAGDQIYSTVWIGNGPTADITGKTGYFFIENVTTGQYTSLSTPIPSNVTFQGNCAEWVMERPTFGTLADLSDYRTATMSSAYTHRSGAGVAFLPYTGASSDQITMTDTTGARKLSTVVSTGSTTMSFTWQNFK